MTTHAIHDKQAEVPSAGGASHGPPRQACEVWHLPGRSRWSPCEARTRVLELCRRWRLAEETADDLAIITSELTTNAIIHAPGDTVCVSIMLTSYEAHVVIIDHGGPALTSAQPPADDEHGRGLLLVEALTSRFVSMSAGEGTVAWASVSLPEAALSVRAIPAAFDGRGFGELSGLASAMT